LQFPILKVLINLIQYHQSTTKGSVSAKYDRNLLVTIDFKITDTHSERCEIYFDSDHSKVIEDFAQKWSN